MLTFFESLKAVRAINKFVCEKFGWWKLICDNLYFVRAFVYMDKIYASLMN